MAGRQLADVTAILQDKAPQLLVDTLDRRAMAGMPSMLSLIARKPPSGADGPQWQVKIAGRTAPNWFPENGAFKAAGKVDYLEASLDFVWVQESVRLTGRAEDTIQFGTFKVVNQLTNEFKDAVETILDDTEANIHANDPTAGGDAGQPTGLDAALGSLTNTYANINRATTPSWQPVVNDAVAGALTLALMEATHDEVMEDHRGKYNAILTSQAKLRAYLDLRNTDPGPQERIQLPMAGEAFSVHFSPTNAFFAGRPILVMPSFPTDRMYFVQTDMMWIEVIRKMRVSKMREENDDKFWHVSTGLQFVHKNPHRNGSLINLA